jgi:GTPase Era involved in 16S rRNA processing
LKGDGIADLKRYLLNTAKPNNFDFPSVVYTDEDPRHTVKKIVKAKFLDVIPSDVPYKINPVIQTWC